MCEFFGSIGPWGTTVVILCIFFLLKELTDGIERSMTEKKYQKQCKEFEEACARGDDNHPVPVRMETDGSFYIKPSHILMSRKTKEDMKKFKEVNWEQVHKTNENRKEQLT